MKRENKIEVLSELLNILRVGPGAADWLLQALACRIKELKEEDNNAVIKPPLDIDLFNHLPVVGRKIVLVCLQQDGPIGFRIVLCAGLETTGEPEQPNFAWIQGDAIPVLSVTLTPSGIKDVATHTGAGNVLHTPHQHYRR